MTREIALNHGLVTRVDAADYDWLNQWKWRVGRSGKGGPPYAVRTVCGADGRWVPRFLHRLLLSPAPGLVIDHINGDTLDNRRLNLRVCTQAQNVWNQRTRNNNTSGFKGVRLDRRSNRWQASICRHGRSHWLGYYDTAELAGRAYDDAARRLHGAFARLNFPDDAEAA